MKLLLKNIGKIKESKIQIDGITVIAGENNTGKSTVGKTLFTIFDCLLRIDEKIKTERILSIRRLLNQMRKNVLGNAGLGGRERERFPIQQGFRA